MQIHQSASAMLMLYLVAASPAYSQVKSKAKLAVPAAVSVALPAVRPFVPRFVREEIPAEPVSIDDCDKPVFPKASLRNEETGTVQVWFKIASDGSILQSAVGRSSGFRGLDKSALDGFSTCKFRPATLNGRPIQGHARVAFRFTLD